ncbi:MAG TPA: N-acetyl-alpha-D-glucosaminyl L-malate synthase BshA [Candidatus Polarisedimenticolaceae bacterium]|nr:N-acetyl-alpha-D-glucosaminyl L-malate synthase BshA [Candidatus Polarisedimenticolaceae bacterium]
MSAPLSVAVVCFPSLGGSGIIATDLAAGLARRGHRVHVIASGPPSRTLPACERLFVHEVAVASPPPLQHPPYAIALASTLVDLVGEHGIDLLHVHYAIPHAVSAYLARQVLGEAAPRLVTTLHGTDVTHLGVDPSYRSITRFVVERSDAVTTPSLFLRQATYRTLGVNGGRSIEVLPNFVDTDHFAPAARRDRTRFDALFASARGDPQDRGAPVLFHVSSFRSVKRVTDLVEVLAAVRKRARVRLMLVGDGPERARLVQRARELQVLDSLCLVGTHAEFADYLRHADAFLLPSETESFGVAALEALASGVPVLGYAVGGLPEVVTPEVGVLIPPYDIAALAEATGDLLFDEARREALGRAARARATERFGREEAIDRYEAFYRRVLADGRKA